MKDVSIFLGKVQNHTFAYLPLCLVKQRVIDLYLLYVLHKMASDLYYFQEDLEYILQSEELFK